MFLSNILNQWAWSSMSTRNLISSDQNSIHPLLWIAHSANYINIATNFKPHNKTFITDNSVLSRIKVGKRYTLGHSYYILVPVEYCNISGVPAFAKNVILSIFMKVTILSRSS